MSNDYVVKPVHKALQVLLHLGRSKRELTLTEIAMQMSMAKTTVYRYLQTFSASGFVVFDTETQCYRLGLRLWELGQLVDMNLPVREVALPVMEELRDRFNETINLGVLDGKEVVYLGMAESSFALRMQARLGARDPIYSTALGKAILAFLPEQQWPILLPTRLTARTSQTITSIAALRHELAETRKRGYSIDRSENEEGSYCIGAPIRDQRGFVAAAISLSAPAMRLHSDLRREITVALLQAAENISVRLGYTPEVAEVA